MFIVIIVIIIITIIIITIITIILTIYIAIITKNIKKAFVPHIKMLNLSLNELKVIAKNRGIKGYKSMFEDDLIKIFSEPKTKSKLSEKRIKDTREDINKLRDRFSKPKIKEIRKNLYEIENKKNLSKPKIKKIEQNLIELEESLLRLNKYYDYDDIEYKGIGDIGNLFGKFIDEDYNKPIKTKGAFDDNYIEYESKGDKDKKLSVKEYL